MIMAYGINNNKVKEENKNLNCWICDKLGSNDTIFKYNTVFDRFVKCHSYCINKCYTCRKRCIKKKIENFTCLIAPHNQIFIYNMTEIYMIYFSIHKSIRYNLLYNNESILMQILKPHKGEILTMFKIQYINLAKQKFKDYHLHYYLLTTEFLTINELTEKVIYFYIQLILPINKEKDYNTVYKLLKRIKYKALLPPFISNENLNLESPSIKDIMNGLFT